MFLHCSSNLDEQQEAFTASRNKEEIKWLKKGNGFLKYTTYSFVDKDPIIDVLRTAKRDAGMKDSEIAAASKLSPSTLKNWFGGKTRRPQFATVAAAAVAMGMGNLPITAEGRRKLKE